MVAFGLWNSAMDGCEALERDLEFGLVLREAFAVDGILAGLDRDVWMGGI
jgi:hypothetical protein